MKIAFADRQPTPQEIEKLRLILSTYQDGSGMIMTSDGSTLPGWRDFERSVALAFDGVAQESKYIFDVLIRRSGPSEISYGLSCKMRSELNKVDRSGRVSMELSNSSGKFWDNLSAKSIDQSNYKTNPSLVGTVLIKQVESWHTEVSIQSGGNVDLTKSYYLVLEWGKKAGLYQLFQFPLRLPDPENLRWSSPIKNGRETRRIVGEDTTGTIIEWYGQSGGQLKYYPHQDTATWKSGRFQLEPLPSWVGQRMISKAAEYFPDAWERVSDSK